MNSVVKYYSTYIKRDLTKVSKLQCFYTWCRSMKYNTGVVLHTLFIRKPSHLSFNQGISQISSLDCFQINEIEFHAHVAHSILVTKTECLQKTVERVNNTIFISPWNFLIPQVLHIFYLKPGNQDISYWTILLMKINILVLYIVTDVSSDLEAGSRAEFNPHWLGSECTPMFPCI